VIYSKYSGCEQRVQSMAQAHGLRPQQMRTTRKPKKTQESVRKHYNHYLLFSFVWVDGHTEPF
jgi:hypothetical protein